MLGTHPFTLSVQYFVDSMPDEGSGSCGVSSTSTGDEVCQSDTALSVVSGFLVSMLVEASLAKGASSRFPALSIAIV